MISQDFKDFLPFPNTSWQMSQDVKDRLEPTHKGFKSVVILSSDPEPLTNEQPDERQEITTRWKTMVQPFSPFELTIDRETETIYSDKVLPLWHGTFVEKCHSIAKSGFTLFYDYKFLN